MGLLQNRGRDPRRTGVGGAEESRARDEGDGEGKAREQKPSDADFLADARPEWPRLWPLADGVERALHLVHEVEAEPWKLGLVPVAGRGEILGGAGVESDSHARLPTTPAIDEPRADRLPVLGGDRSRADLAGAVLQLGDPRVGRIGVAAGVEAQQKLVREARTIPCGKGEGRVEDAGRIGSHRSEYSHTGLTEQGRAPGSK